jgi:hypothetical protein
VRSGDRYQRIHISTKGGELEKLVGTHEAIEPAMAHLLGLLDAIAVQVSGHPRQVLRLELRQPVIRDRSKLSFTLVLAGAGDELTICRSPIDLLSGENGALSIEMWPDRPVSSLHPDDLLTLAATSVRAVPGSASVALNSVLQLRPGSHQEFNVDVVLPPVLPVEGVVIRAFYSNYMAQSAGRSLLVGQLITESARAIPPI